MDPSGNIDTSLRGLYDYGDILAAIELMVKTGYSTVKQATPAGIATSIIFKPSKVGETEKDLKNDVEFQKFLSGGGTGDPNKGNNKKDKKQGNNVKFKDAKELERKYNLPKNSYHRDIKENILKQLKGKNSPYKDIMKKAGNNPDMGIDDLGRIWIKSRIGSGTYLTDLIFESFLP